MPEFTTQVLGLAGCCIADSAGTEVARLCSCLVDGSDAAGREVLSIAAWAELEESDLLKRQLSVAPTTYLDLGPEWFWAARRFAPGLKDSVLN